MPPVKLRAAMRRGEPDIAEVVALADAFAVSKEAMARSWVDARDDAVAVIITEHERVLRIYRNQNHFPWIDISPGQPLPGTSIGRDDRLTRGSATEAEECEPELWLDQRSAARIDILSEQYLAMSRGYGMMLLHAELREDDED